MSKQRFFTVMLNGASNRQHTVQLSYYDHEKGKYVYVSQTNEVKSGELPTRGVKSHTFDKSNPAIRIRVPNQGEPNYQKDTDLINFYKNWPRVGKSDGDNTVNSYPSRNHKLTYSAQYETNPNVALDPFLQDMIYVDEVEVAKVKNKNISLTREVFYQIDSLKEEKGALGTYAYMYGINPVGCTDEELENMIIDYIENNKTHESFIKSVKEKQHNDPVKKAIYVAIGNSIITLSETGMYNFEGYYIGKSVEELAYHFKTKTEDWQSLRNKVGKYLNDLPVNPMDEVKKSGGRSKSKAEAVAETEDDTFA